MKAAVYYETGRPEVFRYEDVPDPVCDASSVLVDVGAMARTAERLGFESFWCAEHPFMPVRTTSRFPGSADGVIPEAYSHFVDPFVALARASGTTKRIRLGTGIVLVPERHPLLLAKEVATLDRFSGGRFLFGIGAGWLREETEIMGGDFDHRWTQTRESVLAMKALWTKPEAEFQGRYYRFPLVRSYPKPAQQPHPPVLLGGSAKTVLQRVVAWGDGWLPNAHPEVAARTRELHRMAADRGHAPPEVTVIHTEPEVGVVRTYAEAGVARCLFSLPSAGEAETVAHLEQFRRVVEEYRAGA